MTAPLRLRLLAASVVTVLAAGVTVIATGSAVPNEPAPVAATAVTGGVAPTWLDRAAVQVVPAVRSEPSDAVPITPPGDFDGVVDTPVAPAPDVVAPASGTGTWAVVIGIDDYPGSRSDLRSAVHDARDFSLALDHFGVPTSQRRTLLDRSASRDAIADALSWLTANAGPDATAIVFYAGHVRKVGRGSETIVGADGRTLSDDAFAARLADLAAERTWIVMAACYGAGFDEALEDGRILTAASGANQLAYESSLYQRSYLVQFVIREAWLEGAAAGTVQAAFAHGSARIADLHPARMPVQLDRLGTLRLGPDPTPASRAGSPKTAATTPAPSSDDSGPGSGPSGGGSASPEPSDPDPRPPERNCTLSGLVEICD